MLFVETPIFTEQLLALLSDEEYRKLQAHLCDYPDAGAVIAGTGGFRKVRWTAKGKGKSGGARLIYFWRVDDAQILFIAIYGKGVKTDLTSTEKKQLKRVAATLK